MPDLHTLSPKDTSPASRYIESRSLTANIVSTIQGVLDLTGFVRSLVQEPGMLDPRFFLASLLPRRYRPCVVVVSQGRRIVGLLYAQERIAAGIPTSVVLADGTLGTLGVARPEDLEPVMHCAVAALLRHKAALRFRVPPDSLDLLRNESAKANVDIHFCRQERHLHLELPRTYEEFLARVRRPTRHNFYRYRRRSEQEGNEFCTNLPFTDFVAAANNLFPSAAYPPPKREFRRFLAMIEAMPSRLLIGLRRSDGGDWLSLAGGWYAGSCAYLVFQLNDRACKRESVSLVLRSYLIEHLINRGIRELVFWGGTSAPLNLYTARREQFAVYVDSRSRPWRLVRRACITLAKFAPVALGRWLKWQPPQASGQLKA